MSGVIVVGAGSLGTLYGAALARGGADVQLLARPAHAAAITAAGHVVVEDGDGEWTARLRATADPAAIEPAPFVLLLTQAQDSDPALRSLAHVAGQVELAISLQNGGGTEAALQGWCGAEHVGGGTSMVGATLLAPGRIRFTGPGLTYVGELDGTPSERTRRLGALLDAGGLEVLVTEKVRSAEWSKLLNAAPSLALTALPRVPMHVAFGDPDLSRAYARMVKEGAAVAAAHGVTLDDWPGMVPVASVAREPLDVAAELIAARGRHLEATGATEITTSMLRSVQTGRPLEIESVFGFLCREAERHGIEVPGLRLAYAMLAAIDRRAGGR